MKIKHCILFLLLVGFHSASAQKADKNYITQWIIETIPDSKINSTSQFFINGVPFENKLVDRELSKYNRSDFTTINYLDTAAFGNLILCGVPPNVIILITKGNQNRASIQDDFSLVKSKYPKNIVSLSEMSLSKGEPVLIINGQQISNQNCFEILNRLRIKEIIGINFIKKSVSEKIYGENSKNGLIIITKK